jgi:hypothetical protein
MLHKYKQFQVRVGFVFFFFLSQWNLFRASVGNSTEHHVANSTRLSCAADGSIIGDYPVRL